MVDKVASQAEVQDDNKRLIKVTDSNNNMINEYIYDYDGHLITSKTSTSEIKNEYDNLGQVVGKSSKVNGKTINTSYDSVSRSKGSHPDSLLAPFIKEDCYVGLFTNNCLLKTNGDSISPTTHNASSSSVTNSFDGIIGCCDVNSTKLLSYELTCPSFYSNESGCIAFWFKPSSSTASSTKKYLFSVKRKEGNGFIGVYLSGSKLYLEVVYLQGTTSTLIESQYSVDLSKWNFFALDFMFRQDEGSSAISEYALNLNGHIQTKKYEDNTIKVSIGNVPVYNIGHKYDGTSSSNYFSGKIASLLISKRKYLLLEDLQRYYRLSKDYIINNQLIDSDCSTVDFSQTNLYTINENIQNLFDIYPLHNSVTSLKGNKPIKFDIRKVSTNDKDRTFNFNSKNKRYCYVADGSMLVYDIGKSESKTIAMRVFTDTRSSRQYLLDAVDNFDNNISLFRIPDGRLGINLNGSDYIANIYMNNNTWNNVCLSFKETILSDSTSTSKTLNIRIVLNSYDYTFTFTNEPSFGRLKVSIGRKMDGELGTTNLGEYYNTYPLHGQIEMLAVRSAYCELSTIQTLFEELNTITKVREYDELGMLRKTDLHKSSDSIMSNTYYYKTRTDSKYISKLIKQEAIKTNGTTLTNRNYGYNELGQLTSINDIVFGNHTYEYDYRGYLVRDNNTTYTYDNNGNITSIGTKVLQYDSTIKDKLISVGSKAITYDTSIQTNPKRWSGNTYTFEGRRLTMVTNSSGYMEYKYNDQGLRIEKKNQYGQTWKYVYDEDRLIYEVSSNNRIDYLYDEANELYGFIVDFTDKYFYVRDIYKNILGIIDTNGNLVVQYTYNAYGGCTSISGSLSSTIGVLNPFRYKGYYYDSESGMYYCKSRYYVHEWGRFLNSDSITSVELDNMCNMNLYAYCCNDPVNKYDPSGHFAILVFLGFVAISAIAGAIDGGVTAAMSGQNFWKGFAAGAIGGAIGGAINYFCPGVGNLFGRAASTMIYDITNEIFQTGTFDINNLGLYVADTMMDVALSMLYLDKVGSIAN